MPLPPPAITLTIARVVGPSLHPAATAPSDAELVVVVHVPRGTPRGPMAVEFFRGDERRDGRVESIDAAEGEVAFAYRLHWSDRPGASSRLTVRVSGYGRRWAERTVLLAPPTDAQGRLRAAAPASMLSDTTRLSIAQEFERLFDGPEETLVSN